MGWQGQGGGARVRGPRGGGGMGRHGSPEHRAEGGGGGRPSIHGVLWVLYGGGGKARKGRGGERGALLPARAFTWTGGHRPAANRSLVWWRRAVQGRACMRVFVCQEWQGADV